MRRRHDDDFTLACHLHHAVGIVLAEREEFLVRHGRTVRVKFDWRHEFEVLNYQFHMPSIVGFDGNLLLPQGCHRI